MNSKTVLLALALFGAVATAPAVELVTNGGFEATTLGQGWSWSSSGNYSLAGSIDDWNEPDPFDMSGNTLWMGGYAELDDLPSSDDVLSQSIDTSGYATATLALDLVGDGFDVIGAPDPFDYLTVSFGGQQLELIDLGNGADPFKRRLTYDISGLLGGTKTLSIAVHNDDVNDASAFIDNISIVAAPVPEPASMAALALGAAALVRRRRK